ncbi:hypothetical protein KKG41_01350 [Patescibacteria group bacterium]|nr:hypothetical protein [Patescibacteria group bacterium]MBU1890922.1 hypothetical protein [Patescibacteria group bacterium]
MAGIVVLTKDGRHPRDGGVRQGYIAGDIVFPFWQHGTIPLAVFQQMMNPRIHLPTFGSYPQARWHHNKCPSCFLGNNPTVKVECRDKARQMGKCQGCGTIMRPYAS